MSCVVNIEWVRTPVCAPNTKICNTEKTELIQYARSAKPVLPKIAYSGCSHQHNTCVKTKSDFVKICLTRTQTNSSQCSLLDYLPLPCLLACFLTGLLCSLCLLHWACFGLIVAICLFCFACFASCVIDACFVCVA